MKRLMVRAYICGFIAGSSIVGCLWYITTGWTVTVR